MHAEHVQGQDALLLVDQVALGTATECFRNTYRFHSKIAPRSTSAFGTKKHFNSKIFDENKSF